VVSPFIRLCTKLFFLRSLQTLDLRPDATQDFIRCQQKQDYFDCDTLDKLKSACFQKSPATLEKQAYFVSVLDYLWVLGF